MTIKLMLLCKEAYFAEIFSTYLNGTQKEFSVSLFTDEDKAIAFLSAHPEEVQGVMADEGFLKSTDLRCPVLIALGSTTDCTPELGGLLRLNIFQRRREILGDLKQILAVHLGLSNGKVAAHTKVIGFFSTQGGSGKTTLAYLTAVRGAQRGKTAYLNLECAPYTAHLFKAKDHADVGELLFAIKDRRNDAKSILPALMRNHHDVYTLPPIASLCDRKDLTEEDIAYLLEVLLQQGELDYLMIDMSADFTSFTDAAFAVSTLVALVYNDDGVGDGKRSLLQGDPAYESLPFSDRAIVVGNRCAQKYTDKRYGVQFPFSQSLGKGVDVATVLGGNQEFADGCDAILAAAER